MYSVNLYSGRAFGIAVGVAVAVGVRGGSAEGGRGIGVAVDVGVRVGVDVHVDVPVGVCIWIGSTGASLVHPANSIVAVSIIHISLFIFILPLTPLSQRSIS